MYIVNKTFYKCGLCDKEFSSYRECLEHEKEHSVNNCPCYDLFDTKVIEKEFSVNNLKFKVSFNLIPGFNKVEFILYKKNKKNEYEEVFKDRIRINYCPLCGRRLSKDLIDTN